VWTRFSTPPDKSLGTPILLYSGNRVFPSV